MIDPLIFIHQQIICSQFLVERHPPSPPQPDPEPVASPSKKEKKRKKGIGSSAKGRKKKAPGETPSPIEKDEDIAAEGSRDGRVTEGQEKSITIIDEKENAGKMSAKKDKKKKKGRKSPPTGRPIREMIWCRISMVTKLVCL